MLERPPPARSHLHEKLTPVSIVAARNGTFSGQVVVASGPRGSGKPLEELSARVSALRQAGGDGVIPASAVQIRYGRANPFWQKALGLLGFPPPPRWKRWAGVGGGTRFDVLLDAREGKEIVHDGIHPVGLLCDDAEEVFSVLASLDCPFFQSFDESLDRRDRSPELV